MPQVTSLPCSRYDPFDSSGNKMKKVDKIIQAYDGNGTSKTFIGNKIPTNFIFFYTRKV
jgi:hypothetical protein